MKQYQQANSLQMRMLSPATKAILIDALSWMHSPGCFLNDKSPQDAWSMRQALCPSLGLDPMSLGAQDPIPLLQLFVIHFLSLRLDSDSGWCPTCSVPDVCPDGVPWPSAESSWRAWFLWARFQALKRDDNPPSRVKPLLLAVVAPILDFGKSEGTTKAQTVSACLVISIYFLLRPAMYLGPPLVAQFWLCNVHFWFCTF